MQSKTCRPAGSLQQPGHIRIAFRPPVTRLAAQAQASSRVSDSSIELRAAYDQLKKWLLNDKQVDLGNVDIRKLGSDFGPRPGFVAAKELQANQVSPFGIIQCITKDGLVICTP